MVEASGQVDRIDAFGLEGVDCGLAAVATAAVDEVGAILFELTDPII